MMLSYDFAISVPKRGYFLNIKYRYVKLIDLKLEGHYKCSKI